MKHTWLFFGCVFLILRWMDNIVMQLLFLMIMIVYYYKHYSFHMLSLILFSMFLILCCIPKSIQKPVSKTMQVKEIRSNYSIANNGAQNVVVYGADKVNFGDVIVVQGSYDAVDTIHNIRSFSFSSWLARRNIYYQINAKSFKVVKEGKSLRHRLFSHVQAIQDKKQREWIQMMLYGIHDDEVSFFVTSSGMHISYVFYMIEKGLLLFLSKEIAMLLVLIGIGGCGLMSVFSSSLLRVVCFRGVRYVCGQHTSDDILGISMLVLLFVFPYMAYELAFLLPVGFRLVQMFNVQRRKRRMTAFCVLIPIQFMYFHVCNPIQILLFQYLRVIYAFLYALCWVMLLMPISVLLSISLFINQVLEGFTEIGFSLYYTPSFWWLISWIYMVCKFLSFQDHARYMLCVLLLYAPYASYFDPFGEIVMLDVGQGDCTLVKLPFHQGVMLIDVMGSLYKNVPKDIIVPTLKGMGIHKLDKVIITHQDYDHSGGLAQLQELMKVEEVITTKQKHTKLGSLTIPFVMPEYTGSDENENSIITYMDVYGLRILFMGDAGSEAERVLLEQYPNMKVDILKVGHHGSKTSSSLAFLHTLQPQLGLISAGRNNRYHHPNEETLMRLKQENIYPLITARSGGISIKFCKYFAFFRTADNEFGIIRNR